MTAVKWRPESRKCRRHRHMAFSLTVDNDGQIEVHSHMQPDDVAYALLMMAAKLQDKYGRQ